MSCSLQQTKMLPNHSILTFVSAKSSGNALVHIKKEVDDETYNIVSQFLDDNFKRNGKNAQWIIKADESDDLCSAVDDILNDMEQDGSDDELIQEALARRFKSESSGKHIEEDKVDDSEDEDVVSICRRLRHLYNLVKKQEARIADLEARLETRE